MLALQAIFGLSGALVIVLAIPLLRRRIGPNVLYGLRVPATYQDEWVWYEANARSARDMIVVGFLIALGAFAPSVVRFSEDAYALGMAALMVVGMVFIAIIGWRRANRLLEQRRATGEPLRPLPLMSPWRARKTR